MSRRSTLPPPSTRNTLEEAFFLKEDQRLIEKLQEMKKMRETKAVLAEVSGISNDEVLEKLVSLSVSPQTVASLAAVPLVEVAWADGSVDAKERAAIADAVRRSGPAGSSIEWELVESWLEHRPGPELLEAWSHYVKGLCGQLSPTERASLRDELLRSVRTVANASGGLLGLRKISAAEQKMIEKLEQAFTC